MNCNIIALTLLSATAAYAGETKEQYCETTGEYKDDIEKILGKWPAPVVSKISRIVFLPESADTENKATYNANTGDITVTAENISSVDHELGHLVYKEVEKLENAATAPLLDEYHLLKQRYKTMEELWKSAEYEAVEKKITTVQISPTLRADELEGFLLYLENYPEAQCSRAYLKTTYEEFPILDKKLSEMENIVEDAVAILNHKEHLHPADVTYLMKYVEDSNAFTSDLGTIIENPLLLALEDEDKNCSSQDQERIAQIFAQLHEKATALAAQRTKVGEIKNRYEKQNNRISLEARPIYEPRVDLNVVQEELFSRAVSSLVNFYFGPPQTRHFQLDEQILQNFEKIQIDSIAVFHDSVARYRKSMEMYQSGTEPEIIRQSLLAEIPKGVAPPLVCFENSDAYWEDVMENMEKRLQKHKQEQ